ncbi:MAG: hypothetical protein ACI9R3_003983 [Verrucomicrobiales bacterium]|jgi:hypothetical protein
MQFKHSLFVITSGFLLSFATASLAEDTAASLKVGEFHFNGSKEWIVKETPRSMSAGGFTSGTEGAGIEVDFYHFGKGQGGTIDANIARWRGQFQEQPEPKKEILKFGDHKVHIISLTGTFLAGPPFGPKTPVKDQAMLGAIVESKEGHVFVKMTGDAKTVAAATDAFKNLCSSPFKK